MVLENFPAFWNSYLLAMAFTGHKESEPDSSCDEPIFSNPGGDISEVVNLEELESQLPPDTLASLLTDCLGFYLAALPMIGTECERAGADFHFTRNGHGTGFWDRGDIWGDNAQKLTELSKPYGTCELVQCADGTFYTHN